MKSVAESPSKAIITGEHFVVHGSWALAAAVNRYVRVEVSDSRAYAVESVGFKGEKSALGPVSEVVESISREYSVDPRVRISIRSDVPEGSGLGSSASVMVAVAAAFAKLRSIPLGKEELVRHSMTGEKSIHGRPSGIDPAICARGGVILFRPGSKARAVSPAKGMSLIVSISGERRKTSHQISRVGSTRESLPGYFDSVASAVSDLTLRAANDIHHGDFADLGRLMTMNHAILSSLGVSTDKLDSMVNELLSLGALGAKLTGAGGGGCVVAVARRGKEKSIVSGLRARGYETFSAPIPVGGVKAWLER
ncbi:MAG TPA: mevalonate kinase [Nitrososphaerales archaeon]|nr:mevalonate kinase [Nitrososphaerales archaeon]